MCSRVVVRLRKLGIVIPSGARDLHSIARKNPLARDGVKMGRSDNFEIRLASVDDAALLAESGARLFEQAFGAVNEPENMRDYPRMRSPWVNRGVNWRIRTA